jgi:hypothetical protein
MGKYPTPDIPWLMAGGERLIHGKSAEFGMDDIS